MTTEEKSLLAVLTAAAVLVPVVLGTALDWPTWSWLLLAVPLLGVPGLVARNIRQRVQREELRDAYVTSPFQGEQQPQHQQTPVADVALPSALEGYDFHFSATACWRPAKGAALQHANLGGLAADALITRAQAITTAERPSRVDVVAHRLAGALGAAQRDATLPWPTSNRRPSPTPTTNCGTDPRPTRSHRCRRSHGGTPHCRMSRSRTISRQTTSPGRSRLTSHEGER